jgi:hypothetical protein
MSLLARDTSSIVGEIRPPVQVQETYGVLGEGAGLTGFLSDIIILMTIIGGIWFLINVVIAGFTLITSNGDSKKLSEFGTRISMMVVGLILMVAAPLIAAIIGFMVFGDTMALLNPTIIGPGN